MGQSLSAFGVAGPVETFGANHDFDAELGHLREAIDAAYDSRPNADAARRDTALRWLREWRDGCLTGEMRQVMLPCLMERCLAAAVAGGADAEQASTAVKFLSTLCPPWARQVLPQARSETGKVAAWAASAAAVCAAASPASARQFASGIAVATLLAMDEMQGDASPLHQVYETLSKAFGDALAQQEPVAVLTLLDTFDALVTELTNRSLPLPGNARYLLKRSIFTQVPQVLGMVDAFFNSANAPPTPEVLQRGADLVSRCVDAACANAATDPTSIFTLQPQLLDAIPASPLFEAAQRHVAQCPGGAATRACCNLFASIAALTNDPCERTHAILEACVSAVGDAVMSVLRHPNDVDVPDVESLVNVVATFVEYLLETASDKTVTGDTNEAQIAGHILQFLQRAVDCVLKIASDADPAFSSPVHACVAVLGRSLHPHRIPDREPGDPADAFEELEHANRKRALAAHQLREPLLLPCLDKLFTFNREDDFDWEDGVEQYIARRSVAIARAASVTAPAASPVAVGGPSFGSVVTLHRAASTTHEASDPLHNGGVDDDADEEPDTRVVDVVGGDPCENYAAAVSAITRLLGSAPFPADGWLPLAMASDAFADPTVAQYAARLASTPSALRADADAPLILAIAQGIRNGVGIDTNTALRVLEAALRVQRPPRVFVAASLALAAVVVAWDAIGIDECHAVARLIAATRSTVCDLVPLPRFEDPTDAVNCSLHFAFRLAASRASARLITGGSMEAYAAIAQPEGATGVSGALGGVAGALDALWVIRAGLAVRGVTDAAIAALRDDVIGPILAEGQLATYLRNVAGLPAERDRTAARAICDALVALFGRTCETLAPMPKALAGLDGAALSGSLAGLCDAGGSSFAVALVGPLVELSGDPQLRELVSTVYSHVASQLPTMDAAFALDTATAMCDAFAQLAHRPCSAELAPPCAPTLYDAAKQMLPGLAQSAPSDLAVDWAGFKQWMTRLDAVLRSSADLASVCGPDYAVPASAVAEAMRVFVAASKARAAANTSRHDDDEDADDWSLSISLQNSLVKSAAEWCGRQPDPAQALAAITGSFGQGGARAAQCTTVDDVAQALSAALSG